MQEKYVLKRVIGQGGMSRVYLAVDIKLHKKWAVKEIDCSGGKDDYLVKALRAETNVLKRLNHKYLPRVVDVYEENERVYLVMDYIEGRSLQEILSKTGPVKREDAVNWGIQIADALSYLHRQRPAIVYRDLKPSNVILREDGTICLIDFGTARICGNGKSEPFGTRGYAAPEQYQNISDERSDIYAFGRTLLSLITGKTPNLVSKWDFQDGFMRIIRKCTQENPDKRYQTVQELMAALTHYKNRQLHQNKTHIYAAGLAIGVSIAVIGMFSWGWKQQQVKQERLNEYRCVIEAGNDALLAGKEHEAAIAFEKAITQIDASNPEGYLCLLRLYVKTGKAEDGILRLEGYIDSDYGGIGSNEELLFEMGRICFYELRDYKNAFCYFEQVEEEEDVGYYLALCRCLSEIHVDLQYLENTLQEFYLYNQSQSNHEREIQNNICIAKTYLTYGEELENGLEQARQILMKNETMEAEEESLRMLTTIYRLLGKKDSQNRKYYYEQSLKYTRQLFEMPGVKEGGVLYRLKVCDMAEMYEELGNETAALKCYEMC